MGFGRHNKGMGSMIDFSKVEKNSYNHPMLTHEQIYELYRETGSKKKLCDLLREKLPWVSEAYLNKHLSVREAVDYVERKEREKAENARLKKNATTEDIENLGKTIDWLCGCVTRASFSVVENEDNGCCGSCAWWTFSNFDECDRKEGLCTRYGGSCIDSASPDDCENGYTYAKFKILREKRL